MQLDVDEDDNSSSSSSSSSSSGGGGGNNITWPQQPSPFVTSRVIPSAVNATASSVSAPSATSGQISSAEVIDTMRSQPPSKLPNFGVASEARSPDPQVVLSPSPPTDEEQKSPFATTPSQASFPHSGIGNNVWHALAAASGAPTPSLDGPSSMPRGSPMLGRPFEQLNIGGSWSGANLTLSDGLSSQESPSRSRPGVPSGAIVANPPPIKLGGLAQRRANKSGNPLFDLKPSPVILSSPLTGLASSSSGSSSGGGSSGSTAAPTRLYAMPVHAVNEKARSSETLILDIRPPSSFRKSHLPNALSVPVPSTLLRRPAFDTHKLLGMLGPAAREQVARWRQTKDIIIIDQDSTSSSESTVLQGLASKFEREDYAGNLWFINGGHSALETDDKIELVIGESDTEGTPATGEEDSAPLGIGRLSRMAFQQGSTRSSHSRPGPSKLKHDNVSAFRLGGHFSQSTTDRHSAKQASAAQKARLQPANPFFDNIRQNLELSHGGITERIPLGLPDSVMRRANELPGFLRDLVTLPDKDSQDLLAKQFYRIERGEQKRLQSVMDVLSKASHEPETRSIADEPLRNADEIERLMTEQGDNGYYPFSITAGVERGTKNRYKNIWPYDFSRVRLGTPGDDSDYINASFVQPRGTARRYIATQGPLDATYCDFWTLIWEQNVRVIVMLTKQYEGGLIKCGQYWKETQYGDIHLRLDVQTGGEDKAHDATSGFDFGPPGANHSAEEGASVSIKRIFTIWHGKHPEVPPRRVTQIQCVNWPDFDVPDAPEILLDLMHDVDKAVEETGLNGCHGDRCEFPPVLVHCSAGVNRTGSFILVDAITDGLRREYRERRQLERDSAARDHFPGLAPIPQSTEAPSSSLPSKGSSTSQSNDDATPQHRTPMNEGQPKQRTVSFAADTPPTLVLPQPVPIASPTAMDVDSLPPLPTTASGSTPSSETTTPEYEPRPITQSHIRHRVPTPLSSMKEPILEVLQAMRVQRMSLVQSLRQYLFVHRAIIAHYLAMVDEESRRPDSFHTHASSNDTNTSFSTAPTSATPGVSGDDESSFKRKSSSTDLQPQMDVRVQLHTELDSLRSESRDGAVNLAKRASFKKRRAANGEDGKGKSVPGSATPSPRITATSPKPTLRRGKS